MDKLSIEKKAKAYDETIERAKKVLLDCTSEERKVVEYITPELKESKDERINKEIITYLSTVEDKEFIPYESWIAWLEKQGDANKEYWRGYREGKQEILEKYAELKKQGEQKFDIEIPFGAKDSELQEASYYIPEGFHAEIESNRVVIKRGEQKPVVPKFKVGDVIRNKWSNHAKKIVRIADDNSFYILDDGMPGDYISAPISDQENWVLVEQNPAWGEEDELHIRELERLVKRVWAIAEHENDKDTIHEMSNLSFFLKTLKPQPKQEWNEEDSPYYDDICEILINLLHSETANINKNAVQKDLDWIKSIRPQNRWKPSSFHLECISDAITMYETRGINAIGLKEILEELKKLKE